MITAARLRTIGTGLLFAALYAEGFPGYGVPVLPFLCLVPLLSLSVSAEGGREAAMRGFVAGTAANLPLYYWIAYTLAVPGKLGWWLGAFGALLVSAYLAIYISAAAFGAFLLARRWGARGLWFFPAAWTSIEMARSFLLTGFPWMLLGYTVSESPLLLQSADIAGVLGVGFLLALSNVFLFRAGSAAAGGGWRAAVPHMAGAAAILVFFASYGSYRLAEWRRPSPAAAVRVGVAQGGIDQSVKWSPAYQKETLTIYGSLTRELRARGAGVIVWPETAAPFFYGWETELSREVDAIASEAGVPLIFGAPWFDPGDGGKYYNSVFLLDGRGVPRGRYDKQHLVPFGEYIPLRPVLSFLNKLTEGAGDFSAGSSPSLLSVGGNRVAASVCYEAVFPGIIRDSVLSGAEWLTNVTNDSWFGDTVAPRQHLAMARMRAVEFRRPMVRAANAGISAVIDPGGETTSLLGFGKRGVILAEIAPCTGMTLYAKTGEIFGISCTIITFFILLIALRGNHGIRIPGRPDRRT